MPDLHLIARYRRYLASDRHYVDRFWDIDHIIWLDRREITYHDIAWFRKRLAANVAKAKALPRPDSDWEACFQLWLRWADWWLEASDDGPDEAWWEEVRRRRRAYVLSNKALCDARRVPLMLYGGPPWPEDERQRALGMPPNR